jgi:nucleoside-diphosphate-sugar epimerase
LRILSLGAGGFIGAHLTECLLSKGHVLVGVDTHTDKIEEFLDHKRFTFIDQDIRAPEFDLEAFITDADLVIDLIAYANPGIYIRKPLEVFQLNFSENLKIAEACVRHEKRLIQFSSCEVYGKTAAGTHRGFLKDPQDPLLAKFSEDDSDFILGSVKKHRWIYACAKQLLERVLHAYGMEGALNYTIIRPFNFIGPKIDYLPEETDGFPRVFSHFMEALIKGTEMKLVDGGMQRRCYTYIDDAIDGIYRIVENENRVCDQQIFNIGSPQNETSIRELAIQMREIYQERFLVQGIPLPDLVDIPAESFYGPGYEDSDRRIPDIAKAHTLLGWAPKWGLRDMLERTMAYYVKNCGDSDR